jgi:hypothetical protein
MKGNDMSIQTFTTEAISGLFPLATDEQVTAVRKQSKVYDEDWTSCDSLHAIQVWDGVDDLDPNRIAVGFLYDDDEQIGLEVTIFNADGTVSESQDFG